MPSFKLILVIFSGLSFLFYGFMCFYSNQRKVYMYLGYGIFFYACMTNYIMKSFFTKESNKIFLRPDGCVLCDIGKDTNLSYEFKRNLITNSSEFYNLSYEYMNDCLRAGLVFRREFYNDSELEAENSLMFKVTLSPFGEISSPKF